MYIIVINGLFYMSNGCLTTDARQAKKYRIKSLAEMRAKKENGTVAICTIN